MNRLFYLCSMAFLALCVAGCGKDSTAETKEPSSAAAEGANFDSLMRQLVDAVAQKDAAKAADAAAKALELQPESAEAHLLAGQAACLGGDYAQAREQFSSVIKEKSLPAALRAKAYAGLGTVEFERHDAESARILFLHALLLDYKNAAARYYLARIYRDDHFYEAAEEQFVLFTRMSKPGDALAAKVTAEDMPELKRTGESKRAARFGAGGGNAEQAAKLIQEAQALEGKKQFTDAAKKYDAARKADPRSYVATRGYARLAKFAEKKDGTRKAIRAYCDAIALKPQSEENYLEAARLARESDQEFRIQAVEILNHAIAHHPQSTRALDLLISALRKTGNTKLSNAWDEYRRALGQR